MILGRKVLQDFELQQTVEVCMKIRKLVNLLPSWKNIVIWRSKEISSNIWWSILEWVGCGNVQQLVEELYEKSCESKHWSIVRHASGLLSKKIPNLALSLTDLIVRQKQVTVGLPPHQEAIISHPLESWTQELLSYLAMFIRTEPNLFHEMIRIRVGLIIQVLCVSKF